MSKMLLISLSGMARATLVICPSSSAFCGTGDQTAGPYFM